MLADRPEQSPTKPPCPRLLTTSRSAPAGAFQQHLRDVALHHLGPDSTWSADPGASGTASATVCAAICSKSMTTPAGHGVRNVTGYSQAMTASTTAPVSLACSTARHPGVIWVRDQDRRAVRAMLASRARGWPGHTVAVFTCAEHGMAEAFALRCRLQERAVLATRPHVRPLLAAIHCCPAGLPSVRYQRASPCSMLAHAAPLRHATPCSIGGCA